MNEPTHIDDLRDAIYTKTVTTCIGGMFALHYKAADGSFYVTGFMYLLSVDIEVAKAHFVEYIIKLI